MKYLTKVIIAIILSFAVTYGIYWLFKTISYQIFYESMVKQTIIELVKPEYLK